MCKRGLCCHPVCVCLSVMLVDCIQTAKDIIKLLSVPGSPIILVFTLSAGTQFQGNPVIGYAKYKGVGGKILRFSTEISV